MVARTACRGLCATPADLVALRSPGFGELIPTAAKNTGETFLALPRGFEYNVIGKKGVTMSDGRPTPTLHDGMHTFKVEERAADRPKSRGQLYQNAGCRHGDRQRQSLRRNRAGRDYDAGHRPENTHDRSRFCQPFGNADQLLRRPDAVGKLDLVRGNNAWTDGSDEPRTASRPAAYPKPHGYCFEVSASANTTCRRSRSKRWDVSSTKRSPSIEKQASFT